MARTLEEPPKTKGHILLDIGLGWLVLYEYSEYWLDFKAYEVIAVEETPLYHSPRNGSPLYREIDEETQEYGLTADVEKASPRISGYVKWDGCSDFDFMDGHVCGVKDLKGLTAVMAELHKLCLLLPAVDKHCAGYE